MEETLAWMIFAWAGAGALAAAARLDGVGPSTSAATAADPELPRDALRRGGHARAPADPRAVESIELSADPVADAPIERTLAGADRAGGPDDGTNAAS